MIMGRGVRVRNRTAAALLGGDGSLGMEASNISILSNLSGLNRENALMTFGDTFSLIRTFPTIDFIPT